MTRRVQQRSSEAPQPPLDPIDTARLTDFARACKAAARAVVLYPAGHPAIVATLGRIVQVTSAASLAAPLRITVLADGLLLDGRAPARADAALGELAALLHSHLIGELTVHPGGDVEAWRSFLLLLGRTPESVRAEGGIARVWTTMAGRHVELREIDYAEVLRERSRRRSRRSWEHIIANCLQGERRSTSTRTAIARSARHRRRQRAARRSDGDARSAAATATGGIGAKAAALIRMLARHRRGGLEEATPSGSSRCCATWPSAVGQLSPGHAARRCSATRRRRRRGRRLVQRGRQPHDRHDDRALRRAPRDRRERARPTAGAGVPDAGARRPISSSGCSRWRTTTSRRRRSAARKGSRRSGTTSPRSC